MASQNLYTAYKSGTKYLLCWMVQASNSIIRKLPQGEDAGLPINSTGKVTVSELVRMAKLIATHLPSIPPSIHHVLKPVIDARRQAHEVFERMAFANPDPELERNNLSHKHFIEALVETYEALGGSIRKSDASEEAPTEDDLDELLVSNKFSALDLGGSNDLDSADESSEAEVAAPARRKASKPGRGKKSKGKKKQKKQPSRPTRTQEEEIPLESYRIIEDFEQRVEGRDGLVTDYLVAVYELFRNIGFARSEIQSTWKEVSYEGLNAAVAGAVSNVAIKMIQNLDAEIFIDFPGNDSYQAVYDAITRGSPDKLRQNFHVKLYRDSPGQGASKVVDTYLDVEEQFLFFAYRDLRDFILDFQLNRTGKPTKRMMSELKDWKPDLDLGKATKEERIQWRRAYTINWLYDLVNLFSSIVVQRNTLKGENHNLAEVDWSVTGPWNSHRRLHGLNEFAGFVTSLAMQKPTFDTTSKILPHHVLQLQFIVDSMSVSRGWFISGLRGHIVTPPSKDFFPRRDVDLFLDRNQTDQVGFLQGEFILKQLLEQRGIKRGDPEMFGLQVVILEWIKDEFRDFLGESKYMAGLQTIPPSRFTASNSNGLWAYSPFLCGVGLLEGLEIAYLVSVHLLETLNEPTHVLHLHNMLVERGFLERPIGLWGSLGYIFKNEFFGPEVPKSDFAGALLACTNKHHQGAQRRRARLHAMKMTYDIPKFLAGIDANALFRQKPISLLLREADWDLDRLSDSDLPLVSLLAMRALGRTKEAVNPVTKKKELVETELVRRARAAGMDVDFLRQTSTHFTKTTNPTSDPAMERMMAKIAKDDASTSNTNATSKPPAPTRSPMGEENPLDTLEFVKQDMIMQVNGNNSILGLSYLWIIIHSFMVWDVIEDELKKAGNETYQSIYGENSPIPANERRTILLSAALQGDDSDCLRIMADVLWKQRTGIEPNVYWKKLELLEEREEKMGKHNSEPMDCVVM